MVKTKYQWWHLLVVLDIHTWVGTSAFGATHYYGTLYYKGKKIKLEKSITSKEAKEFNSYDKFLSYKKGDKTERFNSREELRNKALNEYKKQFPKATILVENSHACLDPCLILDAPDNIKEKAHKIYTQFEDVNGYEGKDQTIPDALFKQWCKLWEEYFKL